MNFFKFIFISLFLVLFSKNVFSQTDENNKNKETIEEEPLPLNDPFAGDASSASTLVSEEQPTTDAVKLRTYKLVATFTGKHQSFVTLVNDSCEFLTLELFEELTDGLKLVAANMKQAVFEKSTDSKFLIMNFKLRTIILLFSLIAFFLI